MKRALAFVCAVVLLGSFSVAVGSDEGDTAKGEERKKPAEAIEVDQSSKTVTDALQGKEGVRIQTMCTHCNSANIQVGGLSSDLVPVSRGGYAVHEGLATSFLLSVLPADTIAEVRVEKGPGLVETPTEAAGGTIVLEEAKPADLPLLDASLSHGSYNYIGTKVRGAGPITGWLSGSITAGREQADAVDDDRDGFNDVGAVDREFVDGRLLIDLARGHVLEVGGSWIEEDTLEGKGAYDVLAGLPPPVGLGRDPDSWTREDYLIDRREYRLGYHWEFRYGGFLDVRGRSSSREQVVVSQLTGIPDSFFDQVLGTDATRLLDRFLIRDEHDWGSLSYKQPLGRTLLVKGGLEGYSNVVRGVTLEPLDVLVGREPEPEIGIDFLRTWSGYLGLEWNPSPLLAVSAGGRVEDLHWGGLDELVQIEDERGGRREDRRQAARVNVRITPTSGLTFRVSGGRTFRPPKPILSEVCCGQRYQRSFDKLLEVGDTYGFEGVYQPSPDLKASVFLAYTDFEQHLLRMVGWSQIYTQTYTLVNIPRSRARRAEAAVSYTLLDRHTLDASIGALSFHNTGERDVALFVTPPSFASPQRIDLPIDRVPYLPVRTASLGYSTDFPDGASLNVSGTYTGSMLIQQYAGDPGFAPSTNLLLEEFRETDGFWMVNAGFTVPLSEAVELSGGVLNLTDKIQTDLADPTTDYNWGPLTGRNFYFTVRYHLDR